MNKVPIWFAAMAGAVWIVWAVVGDAPGERASGALCQDALERRRSFLSVVERAQSTSAYLAASVGAGSKELRGRAAKLPSGDAEARVLNAIADLTAEVERYCGQ